MRFGVDEAGKGPVLGSMFAAAVACEPTALPDGVADSKTLSAARREEFADAIRDVAAVGVAEVPVDRIDDPETDMNTLTVAAHADALSQMVDGGVADDRGRDDGAADGGSPENGLAGVVDAGDVDADRFGRRVVDRADVAVSVTAIHGADETDPLVGAASIVAKVARDAHVETIAERYDAYDVGSGYPSDPATRGFLAEYVADTGELPPCARTTWSTCDDVLAADEQAALGEF